MKIEDWNPVVKYNRIFCCSIFLRLKVFGTAGGHKTRPYDNYQSSIINLQFSIFNIIFTTPVTSAMVMLLSPLTSAFAMMKTEVGLFRI